jgi:hypothetical protein
MPPAVRIEARAWDDPRFGVMGRALGLHRDLALILLARVWAYQTEENATMLPADLFDAITGIDGAAAAAVKAGLADEVDGAIQPRGTADPGRLGWLEKKRRAAQLGGLARTRGERDQRGRFAGPGRDQLAGARAGARAGGLARAAGAARDSGGRMAGVQQSIFKGTHQPDSSQAPASGQPKSSPPVPVPVPTDLAPRSPGEDLEENTISKVQPWTGRGDVSAAPRRSLPSEESFRLADVLRQKLVQEKPDHALVLETRWKVLRPTWARELDVMLRRDKRSAKRAAEVLRWVFGEQEGEYRFVVESPKALRQKFDKLERAMARAAQRPQRGNGSYAIATGGDVDELLVPLERHRGKP